VTKHSLTYIRGPLAVAILIALAGSARGQNTQPVWYPPLSLYGRPVAQPFFDFPVWARYCNCRPAPLAWGYDAYPEYGPGNCDNCWGVDTVNCPRDFACHRPNIWYASADLAPLARVYPNTPLARRFIPATPGINISPPPDTDFIDPGDVLPTAPFFTDPIFDTHDLQSEYDAGGKFTVGAHVLGCLRVEGTYLGAYAWNTSAALHDRTADLATMFSGFVLPPAPALVFPGGATDVNIFSQTRLQSAEANVRYWIDMPPGPFDVSILVGGRYLRIDDSFRFLATNGVAGPNTNDIQAATQNTLWGVQVGIAGDWMIHPRFWINTDLKFGMYDNQSSLSRLVTLPATVPATPAIQGTGRNTALVGDMSFVGHWQMTPNLVFNIGYQLLIVDNIATGIDNVLQPLFPPAAPPGLGPQTNYDKTGQITFHGPVIGLMAIW